MGSSGILMILLGLFFLLSFVTGRLDWLKRLQGDTAELKRIREGDAGAAASATPVFGPTGVAPTTTGRAQAA